MKHFFLFGFALVFLVRCGGENSTNDYVVPCDHEVDTSVRLPHVVIPEDDGKSKVRFSVDKVQPVYSQLKKSPIQSIISSFSSKEVLYVPKDQAAHIPGVASGLFETIQFCYNQHRPLALTPDDIWFAICQGISIHINEDNACVSPLIFKPNKPKNITVRNNALSLGNDNEEGQWEETINAFVRETERYTKDDIHAFMVPTFTTTDRVITTAYEINLLAAYKNDFQYTVETMCGIPAIQLNGKKSDWQQLKSNLALLDLIGLTDWKKEIEPIVDEFIACYDNQINKKFWQEIYKSKLVYEKQVISGWVIKFFPYIKREKWVGNRKMEIFLRNEFIYGEKYLESRLASSNLPNGMSEAPFIWARLDLGEQNDLLMLSGFFGVEQDEDGFVSPHISYAICRNNEDALTEKPNINHFESIEHGLLDWSPGFFSKTERPAIYHPKKYTNPEKSWKQLKKDILSSPLLPDSVSLAGKEIEIYLYATGTPAKLTIDNKTDTPLGKIIWDIVISLDTDFRPARTYRKALYGLGEEEQPEGLYDLVPVNSTISLTFIE